MIDLAADNARLRQEMSRVIAEREIAVAALRDIARGISSPSAEAEQALMRIVQIRRSE